jgi:two-component system sensor histidine kinase SenX3
VESWWFAALGLALGVLVGAAVVLLARRPSLSASATPVPAVAPAVSDDVARLLAVLPGAGLILASDGSVLRSTPAAAALGLTASGRLVVEPIAAMVRACRIEGSIREDEVSIRRSPLSRTTTELRVRVAPLSPTTVLVLADDLSEARRLDAVRRDFVANVSHELKTPVGALSLLAEAVLAASDEPESVQHFAGRMQVEATRLGALVNDVIDLSRLQGDDPMKDAVPVPVDRIVAEAVDATRLLALAKDIDVVRGGDVDCWVVGDERHLATALRNLVSNAVNYSPEHTRVAVAVRVTDSIVEMSVTDQGIGIEEGDRERIFERFYRVDPARSRGTGGTGLGLAIVKHVLVNHGGEVTVWSRLGEGSTFTLRLPAWLGPHAVDEPGRTIVIPAQGERVQ